MSAIAEIRYAPGPDYGEQRADFIDADGSPQATRWGSHTVEWRFSDAAGRSVDHAVWGFAEVRYSHDGRELTGVAYRNAAGETVQPAWNPAH